MPSYSTFFNNRGQPLDIITSGIHFGLLGIGLHTNTRSGWAISLGLISLISFFTWAMSYRRQRLVGDTPISRVASAAQGYVELYGTAEQPAGTPVISKLTSLPCTWYRYSVEEKNDNDWRTIDSGCSDETFSFRDSTGKCFIDPDGAEVITTHKQIWYENNYRYTEYLLLAEDHLYAIGEFSTLGGNTEILNQREDIAQLLTEWKKNKAALLSRFDLNKDGQIDMQEWALARAEAQREVEQQHRSIRLQDSFNILRKPADGRLFLLANLSPEQLQRKYGMWTIIHLVIGFASGGLALFNLA